MTRINLAALTIVATDLTESEFSTNDGAVDACIDIDGEYIGDATFAPSDYDGSLAVISPSTDGWADHGLKTWIEAHEVHEDYEGQIKELIEAAAQAAA